MQFQGYLYSRPKCSVFQLFTDELAHDILGCDNRVCKLSVSFASWSYLPTGFLPGHPPGCCLLGAVLRFLEWRRFKWCSWRGSYLELLSLFGTGNVLSVWEGRGGSRQLVFQSFGVTSLRIKQDTVVWWGQAFRNLLAGSSWWWPWASSPTLSSSTT